MIDFAVLAAPFPPSRISWRVGATNADKTKGMALAYIDARDVLERLDAVCTPAGWQCEYVDMTNGTTCCRIGIKVGDEWIWKANGGSNIAESDKADAQEMAAKGGYSDAFKRAGVQWGIGRYLYDLDSPWVAIEQKGRSYVIAPSEFSRLEGLLARTGRPLSQIAHGPTGGEGASTGPTTVSPTDRRIADDLRKRLSTSKTITELEAAFKAPDFAAAYKDLPASLQAAVRTAGSDRRLTLVDTTVAG